MGEETVILYVEDNLSNIVVVERIAESLGHKVVIAATGQSGIDLAHSLMPSLILMDIGLPDIDGITVTRMLRADEKTTQIPIIAVTAHAMNGDRERCLAAGCDDYLAKPFQVKQLSSVIRHFVKRA